MTPGIILSIGLLLIGFIGMILRRNLFFIMLNSVSCFLGLLVTLSSNSTDADQDLSMQVLLLLFALHWLVLSSILVFLYRNRGVLSLDALRDLRG